MDSIRNVLKKVPGARRIYRELCLDTHRKRLLKYSTLYGHVNYGLNQEERPQKIIVSLTSYPKRFDTIIPTLKSLLNQKMKPDRIILWYDCDEKYLTDEMKSLERYGIEFIHVDMDLKPHKKYYYAMKQFPNDLIITVDDDAIYPRDVVSSLYSSYLKYPDCVNARRVHYITSDQDGIMDYKDWEWEYTILREPSYRLLPTGIGGVLYPPHCMDSRVFDLDGIRECINADDIWLKYMELLHGTKVVWTPNNMVTPPVIAYSQETALTKSNVDRNQNDVYIGQLEEKYGVEIKTRIPDWPGIMRLN